MCVDVIEDVLYDFELVLIFIGFGLCEFGMFSFDCWVVKLFVKGDCKVMVNFMDCVLSFCFVFELMIDFNG